MPKINKEIEDHLRIIEFLLAGILLKKSPNLKEVAKVIGCSDKTLTALYPERKNSKNKKDNLEDSMLKEVIADEKTDIEN